jgi:hypothetical protein
VRKLLTAVFALLAALAFFVVGSPSASAFGSEVLGCDAGLGWTASACHSSAALDDNHLVGIRFSPNNTSGSYTTSWTITTSTGATITQTCSSTYSNTPCILTGCSAGSLSCQVTARVDNVDRT